MKVSLSRLYLFVILLFYPFYASATDFTCANPKAFTPIYSSNLYGKLIIAGNTSLCKNDGGVCGDPGNSTNNDINMMYNDYDNVTGTTDYATTTLNSSAAYLDIPAGKTVVWAGLVWQGYMVNWTSAQKEAGHNIKYKFSTDSYQTVTNAQMNWVYFDSSRMYYESYVDITSYVNSHGGGYYWVGDIATTQGQPAGGSFGAWAIAVVYEDYNEDFKNITVYDGYQAFAGSSDINNAISYANANGCSTANTGVGNQVVSTLSGFLTPKDGVVDSSLVVFAGEGDIGLTGDSGSLTDANGTEHPLFNALNPSTNIMNATISKDGVTVTSGLPYYSPNSLGADIDTYDTSAILSNKQTTTDIKFSTSGDGYMPGLYALSTKLYAPKFCYDYAYKQQGQYFTEDNNGTVDPKLSSGKLLGGALVNEPIELTIYIRNLVESDIAVQDMNVSVFDMNTTQVTYIRNTTQLTPINSLTPQSIPDSSLTVNDANILNIPIGSVPSSGYFYLYYQVDPLTSTLNMPINVQADYNLNVGTSLIKYSTKIGGAKMQMCSGANFTYTPVKGRFNVVNNIYYPYSNGNYYYNLPTEVTSRADNYTIVSYDPANLDTPKDINTSVGVELIDAAAFHDSQASCDEPTSAISERIWITFKNSSTASFTGQDIIDNILLEDPLAAAKFYKTARENVAFRISYPPSDDNGSIIVKEDPPGKFRLINFPGYAGSSCVQPVTATIHTGAAVHTKTYTQVPEACANAGSASASAMTQDELNVCMECIYGKYVPYTCSRDNFSLRPEALMIKVNDQNQSSGTTKSRLADNVSGVAAPVSSVVNLSSGYKYDMEITATNHLDNTASPGYTKSFGYIADDNVSYIWEPRGGVVTTGCNDISDKVMTLRFLNGYVETNSSIDQVGDYRLHAIDTTWTKVDHDPTLMVHHSGSYYLSGADCTLNTSATQTVGSTTLNGCNISSSHNNNDASLQYNDYDTTFHPYKFNLLGITTSYGLTNFTTFDTNTFVYMSDMSVPADENMSVHMNGTIRAVGLNGVQDSNFVDSCFAKPVDINITKTNAVTTTVPFQYRFHNLDVNNSVIATLNANINNTSGPISLPASTFTIQYTGLANTILNLNFDRNLTIPINPETITFNNYIVNCQNPGADCTFFADLATKTTQGDRAQDSNITDLNQTVKFYYGRTHAPRYRFPTNTGHAFIYYEVYCDNAGNTALLPNGVGTAESVDELDWYDNANHVQTRDGLIGTVTERKSTPKVNLTNLAGTNPEDATIVYDGTGGYPYKTTMENNASGWLIYNKYNDTATTNEFEVEFYKPGGNWTGVKNTDTTTDSNASDTTSKRIFW